MNGDCVFCQIAAGEMPCQKVWEAIGHTLLIPKKHYRWVWEVSNFGEYFEKLKAVKKILDEKFHPEWVEIKVIGVDVPHAHIHLIPHY